jgi:hypothetical protein
MNVTPAAKPLPPFSVFADQADVGHHIPARDLRWLLGMMALYAVIYAASYPLIYTSIDEGSTFRMVYVLRHGWIYPHDNNFFPSISPAGPHGLVYRFPIAFPAVLAPLTLFGWKALFLLNPLFHLAAAWCFSRILLANHISTRYAILYLFYPSFVLFDRTLFSDPFAASLTTIALYCLLCRQKPVWAGLCLGLAAMSRGESASVALILAAGLLLQDWRRSPRSIPTGQGVAFLLGVLPFAALTMGYNNAVLGGPFKSTYSLHELSLGHLRHNFPIYALSLLLFYPGMIIAPIVYRGKLWKECLAAAAFGLLLAASFEETTHGNNVLQTLISAPRQLLPVMPFYLLAYCAVLGNRLPEEQLRRAIAFPIAGILLAVSAAGISGLHQKYLRSLAGIQMQIARALPERSIVYANKDIYKLHQPIWDERTYRELPYVSDAQITEDTRMEPVFVVLDVRSRGFSDEDASNRSLLQDFRDRFRIEQGPDLGNDVLQCYRVLGIRSTIRRTP